MSKKKHQPDKPSEAKEPTSAYGSENDKTIRFFSSFEEAEEYNHREMAGHTYAQRLHFLELLRKRFHRELLTPEGNWPPLKKTLHIIKATYK